MNLIRSLKALKYIFEIIIRDISLLGSLVFFLFIIGYEFLTQNYFESFFLCFLLVLSYFFVGIIRFFFFKARPKKQKYSSLLEKLDASSFPSMHSTRAALLFFFFSFFYGLLLGVYFFMIWILVSFSRIYLKKHDLFDILFGYLLAFCLFFVSFSLIY